MKSKLVINLRNCQYDLFKTIAIEELGWRVIDNRCNVLEPVPPSEVKKALPPSNIEEDEASTGDNSSVKNQTEIKSKERQKVDNL